MRPSAVLFDCDGVVVDSEAQTFALLGREFASFGLTLSQPQMEGLFLGGTMQGVFLAARGLGANLPEDWVETFYEKLYAELALGTNLVAGIEDVLLALDAAGVPYAIGSNGSEAKMQVTLGQHPQILARFGGHVYSGANAWRTKACAGTLPLCRATIGS